MFEFNFVNLKKLLSQNKPLKMTHKLKKITILSAYLAGVLLIHSCKKDKAAEGTDKELYEMSKNNAGFVWYKNSDALLDKSSGSGHPQPFLKTRFNATAAAQLGSNGKINTGAVFPEGSLIVKELYDKSKKLVRYAILYKNSSSSEADAKGWVWGYLNEDGTVAESSTKKGTTCIGCHSQSDNIDYMLMNKYFP